MPSTSIPSTWNLIDLKKRPKYYFNNNIQYDKQFDNNCLIMPDGRMPDSNLNEIWKQTGVNPFQRENTDNDGWKFYNKDTVKNWFNYAKETYGNIGYAMFRLPARTTYAQSNHSTQKTVLNTTDKMLARLFVKQDYRVEFLELIANLKNNNDNNDEHQIHLDVYNVMSNKYGSNVCFNDSSFVLTENEFPYETHFNSHLLVWVNPFTIERENVNVYQLYNNILTILLNNVSNKDDENKIKESIMFLENMPIARSIKNIRHFHIFVDGIILKQWYDII